MFEIKGFTPDHITNNRWGHNLNNEITMKNIRRLYSVPLTTRFAFPPTHFKLFMLILGTY